MASKSKITPWGESDAKKILELDILVGVVTEDSDPLAVYQSHDAFQDYKLKNFKANLKRLIKTLRNKEERSIFDAEAVKHDTELFPRAELTLRGYPFWDTSEAKVLLASDVEDGIDAEMKPFDLWEMRPEYKAFPLHIFRKHIYQERRRHKQSLFCLIKEEKKKNKKNKKRCG
jgi:hypothetical protein